MHVLKLVGGTRGAWVGCCRIHGLGPLKEVPAPRQLPVAALCRFHPCGHTRGNNVTDTFPPSVPLLGVLEARGEDRCISDHQKLGLIPESVTPAHPLAGHPGLTAPPPHEQRLRFICHLAVSDVTRGGTSSYSQLHQAQLDTFSPSRKQPTMASPVGSRAGHRKLKSRSTRVVTHPHLRPAVG